ncbi:MAG: hypothetical protein ABH863_04085 [Candidatus Micrarchaeota archaeon]
MVKIYSRDVIHRDLFSGLAGDMDARRRYEERRQLHPNDMPSYLRNALKKLTVTTKEGGRFEYEEFGPRHTPLVSFTHSMAGLKIDGKSRLPIDLRLPEDFVEKSTRLLGRANRMILNSTILEDIFTANEISDGIIPEKTKLAIVRTTDSHWRIHQHPIVAKALNAQNHLTPVFRELKVPIDVRITAYGIYMKTKKGDPATATIEWLKSQMNQAAQTSHKPAPINPVIKAPDIAWTRKGLRNELASRFPNKGEQELGEISRRLLTLMGSGHSGRTLIEEIAANQDDPISHLDRNYFAVTATPNPSPKPTILPKEKNKPETHTEILARLRGDAEGRKTDFVTLRNMLISGRVPANLQDEILEHLILHNLAHGSKRGAKYRIKRRNVTDKYLPDHLQYEARRVMDRLVSEGKVVRREGSGPPGQENNVVINKNLRRKYHG